MACMSLVFLECIALNRRGFQDTTKRSTGVQTSSTNPYSCRNSSAFGLAHHIPGADCHLASSGSSSVRENFLLQIRTSEQWPPAKSFSNLLKAPNDNISLISCFPGAAAPGEQDPAQQRNKHPAQGSHLSPPQPSSGYPFPAPALSFGSFIQKLSGTIFHPAQETTVQARVKPEPKHQISTRTDSTSSRNTSLFYKKWSDNLESIYLLLQGVGYKK